MISTESHSFLNVFCYFHLSPSFSFIPSPPPLLPLSLEYLVELREYGPVYSSWAGFEGSLQEPLEGVAGCVANCASALDEVTEDMSEDFLPVLREYVLYIESMKVSMGML